jgi:HEAT repeat protein
MSLDARWNDDPWGLPVAIGVDTSLAQSFLSSRYSNSHGAARERLRPRRADGGDSAFDAAALAEGHDPEELAPSLTRLLTHPNARVRFAAALAVGAQRVVAAYAALAPLVHDRNRDVRLEAIASLGQLGVPDACKVLVPLLKNIDVRDTAARALGDLGMEEAIPALGAAAVGPQEQAQITAIEALGKIGTPEAVAAAARGLDEKSENVIGEAARVIGHHRFAPAVQRLLELLSSLPKWSMTRGWCVEALGEIGDARAVEPLIAIVQDGSLLNAHPFAATALGKLCDTRAIAPLEALFASRDPDVREAVQTALDRLRGSTEPGTSPSQEADGGRPS